MDTPAARRARTVHLGNRYYMRLTVRAILPVMDEVEHRRARVALDWDDTITVFPDGCRVLCQQFDQIFVITLNHGVTREIAEELLGCPVAEVIHSPDERVVAGESALWKSEVCQGLRIDLMIDDDADVIRACAALGIPGIVVGTPRG